MNYANYRAKTGDHMGFMLIKEITKEELTGGHIAIMLITVMAKIELNRPPFWNYPNYGDRQYRNFAIYRDLPNWN